MIGEFSNGDANDDNGEITIGLFMFNGLRFIGDLFNGDLSFIGDLFNGDLRFTGDFRLNGDFMSKFSGNGECFSRLVNGVLGLKFCISPSTLRLDGVAFGD